MLSLQMVQSAATIQIAVPLRASRTAFVIPDVVLPSAAQRASRSALSPFPARALRLQGVANDARHGFATSRAQPLLGRHFVPSAAGRHSMQAFSGDQLGGEFLKNGGRGTPQRPTQQVDFTTLSAVSAELQSRLPLRVSKVLQAGATDISITLHDPSQYEADLNGLNTDPNDVDDGNSGASSQVWLSLSWHRKFGRMVFSDAAPARSSKSVFSRCVHDRIRGLYLVGVRPLSFTRILRLDFSSSPNTPVAAGDSSSLDGADAVAASALQDTDGTGGEAAAEEEDGAGGTLVSDDSDTGWSELSADDDLDNESGAKAVTARIYLQVNVRGHTRVVLVGTDGRVVTTAPAMDQAGVVWSRVGRFYAEPGQVEIEELGAEPSLQVDLDTWRTRLLATPAVRSVAGGGEDGERGRSDDMQTGRRRGGRVEGGGRAGRRAGRGGRRKGSNAEGREGGEGREGEGGAASASQSVKGALMRSYRGLSGDLVEQMLSAAGIPRGELLRTMSEDDFARLYGVWSGWLWVLEDRVFRASARDTLAGLVQARRVYSVVGWPEPGGSRASEGMMEDEEDEEDRLPQEEEGEGDGEETELAEQGEGGGGGASAPLGAGDAIYFDSAAACVQWYYQWAELLELEKDLSERVASQAMTRLQESAHGPHPPYQGAQTPCR